VLLAIYLSGIFDKNLSFAQRISAVSKCCFHNTRDLWRIRKTINHTTACTIATFLIQSNIDYIVSLFYSFCLQLKRIVFNLSSTLLLVLSPKLLTFITLLTFLKYFHWLKINNNIKYKLLSHINLSKLVNLLTSAFFIPFTTCYSSTVFFSYHP